MTPTAPAFSVIVPFRNAAATLPETLASLQAQTVSAWEALLVDDGSTDGSAELVAKAARDDARLRLLLPPAAERRRAGSEPRRGVAATRNIGLEVARGRYVAFLDADDRWLPEKLARQHAAFVAGADIVFTAYRRIDMRGRVLATVPACAVVTWREALRGNPIGCLTGAYRRARFPDARMPAREMHEDYAFWLTLLRTGVEARGLPDVLAEYRVRPGSASSDKWRAVGAVWEILGSQRLSRRRRLWGFLGYAAGAVRKRI